MSFSRCSPRSVSSSSTSSAVASREDNLASVRRGGDPRCEVDIVADVALVGEQRRAGVQADPHLNRPRRERLGEALLQQPALRAPWERRRRTRLPACRPRRRPRQRTPHGSRGGARQAPPHSASAPSSCRSFVEPSTSVKRKVTVPEGRSSRIGTLQRVLDGLVERPPPTNSRRLVEAAIRQRKHRCGEIVAHLEPAAITGAALFGLDRAPEQPGTSLLVRLGGDAGRRASAIIIARPSPRRRESWSDSVSQRSASSRRPSSSAQSTMTRSIFARHQLNPASRAGSAPLSTSSSARSGFPSSTRFHP